MAYFISKKRVKSVCYNFENCLNLRNLFSDTLASFYFVYPSYMLETTNNERIKHSIDSDGDLDVVRKKEFNEKEGVILIGK